MELLERASFLEPLGEYARQARQGDGRLILLSGESGMGKTALVEEFQRHLKGARWLWGGCDGLLTPAAGPTGWSPITSTGSKQVPEERNSTAMRRMRRPFNHG